MEESLFLQWEMAVAQLISMEFANNKWLSFPRRSTPLVTQYQMVVTESMHTNNIIWANCFVVIF